jgi:hypothetical protein
LPGVLLVIGFAGLSSWKVAVQILLGLVSQWYVPETCTQPVICPRPLYCGLYNTAKGFGANANALEIPKTNAATAGIILVRFIIWLFLSFKKQQNFNE